jgi:hypothetical protein
MSRMDLESKQELRQLAAQAQVKAVDLSGEGSREYLANGTGNCLCSPTGNCEVWVFRQNDDKYSVILHRTATRHSLSNQRSRTGFTTLCSASMVLQPTPG